MAIVSHANRERIVVPRIVTRKIVTPADGAQALEMWEQCMPPGGHIPAHYHEVEEVITIISGRVRFTLGAERHEIDATPHGLTTIFIPPRLVHYAENQGDDEVHLLAAFAEVEPRVFLPDGTLVRLPWQTTPLRERETK